MSPELRTPRNGVSGTPERIPETMDEQVVQAEPGITSAFEPDGQRLRSIEDMISGFSGYDAERIEGARAIAIVNYALELADVSSDAGRLAKEQLRALVRQRAIHYSSYDYNGITLALQKLRPSVKPTAAATEEPSDETLSRDTTELIEEATTIDEQPAAEIPSTPPAIQALNAIYNHKALKDAYKRGDSRRIAEAVIWDVLRQTR